MKKSAALLSVLFVFTACASSEKAVNVDPPGIAPLDAFFSTFENDLLNTSAVIAANELIKNLTHLQRMNFGGNRY